MMMPTHTHTDTTTAQPHPPRGVAVWLLRAALVVAGAVAVLGLLYYALAFPPLLGPVALALTWTTSRALKRTAVGPLAYAVDTGIGLWLVELPDRELPNRVAQVAYEVVRRPLIDVLGLILAVFAVIGIAEGDLLEGLSFGVGFAGLFGVIAGRVAVAVLVRRHRRDGEGEGA